MGRISRLVIVALLALGCGTAPIAPAATVAARFGGAPLTLDGHALELVVHASGTLQVLVRGRRDLGDAGLTVTLRDEGGRRHSVATRRVGPSFVGRLEEGTPGIGEAEVLLLRDGRVTRAPVTVTRMLPPPEHGGSMVWLADHPVEVVVDAAGSARVYASERLRGELTLGIPGDDGQLHPLALTWDRGCGCHAGSLEGLTPRPGALAIVLTRDDGSQLLGRGALLEVARDPSVAAPDELRLELPELGSDLPAVIAVPPR